MRQAYHQGVLDGLCGVYSLINVRRLLWPRTSVTESVVLFRECIAWLEDRSVLGEVLTSGMGVNTLIGMSRDVIEAKTPGMLRLRPYYHRKVSLSTYWSGLQKDLSSNSVAMLICMDSWDWSHWTVVSGATKHRFHLFDSIHRKHLSRRHCTLTKYTDKTPMQLTPAQTMLYKRID